MVEHHVIPHVYWQAGRVFYEFETPAQSEWWKDASLGCPLPNEKTGVLVIRWEEPYVRVRGEVHSPVGARQRAGSGDVRRRFASGWHEISKIMQKELGKVPNPQGQSLMIGTAISGQERAKFTIIIDTDHPYFVEQLRAADIPEPISICVRGYLLIRAESGAVKNANQPLLLKRQVILRLEPGGYAPPYQGIVALDLGNTNTTLAAIEINREPVAKNVLICPEMDYDSDDPREFSLKPHHNPIPTLVRIHCMVDPEHPMVDEAARRLGLAGSDELRDMLEGYAFTIGSLTQPIHLSPDGLIVSPKRHLTASKSGRRCVIRTRLDAQVPPRPQFDVPCEHEVELSQDLPASLFGARLLQIFRCIKRAYARRMVVTYPTSYTRSELSEVIRTVSKAWHMAERFNPEHPLPVGELVRLALDEATAAAFYYLARSVLESPGGLRTFRWLYPQGFYLLVYDCGGATIDISLVQAIAPDLDTIRFRVLGRTGLRDFAGDEITVAIFLLLKAKVAHRIAALTNRTLKSLPAVRTADAESSKQLRSLLTDEGFLGECDRLVPTDFDPLTVGTESNRRRGLTMALWWFAEAEKRRIATKQPVDAPAPIEKIQSFLSEFHPAIPESELRRAITEVRVTREEVDSIVYPGVWKSIRVAEALLNSKLHARNGIVDDVFLIGNGSRYPLLKELLEKHLLGQSQDQLNGPQRNWARNFELDENDIKHAVAKGAALALAMKESALGIRLEFDDRLSERLPFSIGWFNAATRSHVVLFEEGEEYVALQPKTIQVQPQKDGTKLQWIRLEHQWPGAPYEPFLLFQFSQGVEGNVTVYYDPERQQFLADCEETGERAVGRREIDPGVYLAPPQRGKVRLLQGL